ncbi:hypothetical protein pfor_33c2923 [Rhodobacteraceae bacterium SB2]|jgi:hypothetical protein|nr:hypothetical protein pfor_33c2923 [Rhodobacteraceae bacterium SB2]
MNKNDQNILNENSTEEVVAVEGETEGSINIDEQSYKVSDLNDKARNIVLFLRRLDNETQEARYNLNKNMLARKQAIVDLKTELEGVNAKTGGK